MNEAWASYMCVGYWKHETYWVSSQIHWIPHEFHPPPLALPLTVEDSRRCVCQTRDFTDVIAKDPSTLWRSQWYWTTSIQQQQKKIEQEEEEEEGHQTKNCCFLQCWFLILNCGWSQCLQFHQKSPFTACFCTFCGEDSSNFQNGIPRDTRRIVRRPGA